ncbi:hypothetical protein H632_c2110p0 [Helicosporidium sp. ATCC 50920]|nr:hypothetical protein H632_c2110p0 [Helicosporidium sp. ATCC 50920]|eukprot:KDD73505.1 hypothetical protein H632_c2110p0 [Helicosporidium sp. ATCC 50920]
METPASFAVGCEVSLQIESGEVAASENVATDVALPDISTARCAAREARAIQLAEKEAAKIGVGVSKRAQQVFDSISKTLPAVWDNKNIIVVDEIVVEHPYTAASCKALHSSPTSERALHRVQLVLTSEARLLVPDAALVDTIGSAALVTKTPYSHVSLAINVNYMNPAKAGRTVRCEGVVSKFGRTVANMTISLYDAADDALLAEGTHIKVRGL